MFLWSVIDHELGTLNEIKMHFNRFCHKKLRNCCGLFSSYRKLSNYIENIKVLGIETSCDDTGCAIVNGRGMVLGEALNSQTVTHLRFGGVNPVIATELHRNNIESVVDQALQQSKLRLYEMDAIAVTAKPGLLKSLVVGVQYAKYLSKINNKPLIPIHHMQAHALVARMYHDIPFPFLVLLISGGHCLLTLAQGVDTFLLLGKGLDNPPGEALDKVARRMKLRNINEYSNLPGGRAIEVAASKAVNSGKFELPIPLVRQKDCNFSFSGVKEALFRILLQKEAEHGIIGDQVIPEANELCAAFQLVVAEHLVHRTERALQFCEMKNLIQDTKNIVVSGGVACNDFIFKSINHIGEKLNYKVYQPPPRLCTDNGIMIAWNGIEKIKSQTQIDGFSHMDVDTTCPIGESLISDVINANLSVRVTRLKNVI